MKIDISLVEECNDCSRFDCELRISYGTPEYTYQYDFNRGITPIPSGCPLPDAEDFPKLLSE